MSQRNFNWQFAFVILISALVLLSTTFILRKWQVERMGGKALETGTNSYNDHQWEKAVKGFAVYLQVQPNDIDALERFAQANLNIRPLRHRNLQQAIAAYRKILRIDKQNIYASNQLIKLYLDIGADSEAQLIAERYLMHTDDPDIRIAMAVSMVRQNNIENAVNIFKSVIKDHPQKLSAYEALAQLSKSHPMELHREPKYWINLAIKNNSGSAPALIARATFEMDEKDYESAATDLAAAESLDISDPKVRFRLIDEFIRIGDITKAKFHITQIRPQQEYLSDYWNCRARLAMAENSPENLVRTAIDGMDALSAQPWDYTPTAAELLIRAGKYDKASEVLQKMDELNIDPAKTSFLWALLAHSKGDNRQAIEHWKRAIEYNYKPDKTHIGIARAYLQRGDNISAIFHFNKAIAEMPDSAGAFIEIASVYADDGQFRKARLFVRRALENTIAEPQMCIEAINTLLKSNNDIPHDDPLWEQVELLRKKAIELKSSVLTMAILDFKIALAKGNLEEAKHIIEPLEKAKVLNIMFETSIAELLLANGQKEQAIVKLKNAIERFPESPELALFLSEILTANGDECDSLLKPLIAKCKDEIVKRDYILSLANNYNARSQQDRAIKLLQEGAYELQNDILIRRRMLLYEQIRNNTETAEQLIREIKEIETESGWQWRYEQAKLWIEHQDFKLHYPDIVALLKVALENNPNNNICRLQLARLYEKAGDMELAITAYEEALLNDPDDVDTILSAAAIMYKAGEPKRADQILEHAANIDSINPTILKFRLKNYLDLNELDRAEKFLEEWQTGNSNMNGDLMLAGLKIRLGKYDKAQEFLKRIEEVNPGNIAVYSLKAELCLRQKQNSEAVNLCDKAVDKYRNSQAHVLRAMVLSALGDYVLAEKDFEKAATLEPNSPAVWAARSGYYQTRGEISKSIECIRKAMLFAPSNNDIRKQTISLLLFDNDKKNVEEGKYMLTKALSQNPKDITLRLYQAKRLMIENNDRAATEILNEIIETDTRIPEAWAMLAEIQLKKSKVADALDLVLSGLKYSPENKGLLLMKAQTEASRAPALAIPTMKLLCETAPENITFSSKLAELYAASGDHQQAIVLLKKILPQSSGDKYEEIEAKIAASMYWLGEKEKAKVKLLALNESSPECARLFMIYSRILIADQDWKQLSNRFERWLKIYPEGTSELVTLCTELGNHEATDAKKMSTATLNNIAKAAPNNFEAIGALASIYQKNKQKDQTTVLYERLIELQPTSSKVLNSLVLELCELQDYQTSLAITIKAIKKYPDASELIDTCGIIHYRMENYQKAYSYFERCLSQCSENSPLITATTFHLGRTAAKLGQKEKAVYNIRRSLELQDTIGGMSTQEQSEAQDLLKTLVQEAQNVGFTKK